MSTEQPHLSLVSEDSAIVPVIRTLLITDFVDSTALVERLGDQRVAHIFERHDAMARDLLASHGGQEIDKTDGFLFLFHRPVDAVYYALAYHESLREMSAEFGLELKARSAVHLGEVVVRENPPEHVARGAKPVEVEGLAKPMVARLMGAGLGGQVLLTEAAAVLARRGLVGGDGTKELTWCDHGFYQFKGVDEPTRVFEVGHPDHAPLRPPPDSEKAHPCGAPRGESERSGAWFLGLVLALLAVVLGLLVWPAGDESSPPSPNRTDAPPTEFEQLPVEMPAQETPATVEETDDSVQESPPPSIEEPEVVVPSLPTNASREMDEPSSGLPAVDEPDSSEGETELAPVPEEPIETTEPRLDISVIPEP